MKVWWTAPAFGSGDVTEVPEGYDPAEWIAEQFGFRISDIRVEVQEG